MSDINIPKASEVQTAEAPSQAQKDYEEGKKFFDNGDLAQAANSFHNALIGFEQENNEEGQANANDKLGDICFTREEYAKALAYFEKTFATCLKHDDLFSMLSLKKKISKCHRSLNSHEKALDLYLEMLETYERLNSPASTVAILEEMAATYVEMDAKDKAADAYKTAASIHANFKHKKEAQELLEKAEALGTV